jgi:hypothetical protein
MPQVVLSLLDLFCKLDTRDHHSRVVEALEASIGATLRIPAKEIRTEWAKEPYNVFCNGRQPLGFVGRCQMSWTTANWKDCCFHQCRRRLGAGRSRTSTRSIRS